LVEVPFAKEKWIAVVFLCWLYRQKISWILSIAKEMSEIACFWNIAGELAVVNSKMICYLASAGIYLLFAVLEKHGDISAVCVLCLQLSVRTSW